MTAVRAVISVDTAGPVAGAALWLEGQDAPTAVWSERVVRGADVVLLPALAELVTKMDSAKAELYCVAVAAGPGAFTGLRVGVSAALGLAMSRGVGVVPISSLAARAALAPDGLPVLALLDARKGRVYAGVFDVVGGVPTLRAAEVDAPLTDVCPSPPFFAVGEGARVHHDAIVAAGGTVADVPDATAAGAMAGLIWATGASPVDAGQVQLHYIRPPDAKVPSNLALRRPDATPTR